MKISDIAKNLARSLCLLLLISSLAQLPCWAIPAHAADTPNPQIPRDLAAAAQLAGRTVEAVRVEGNTKVSSSVIKQLIRTHEGDKFDPNTVVEDYQRVYDKMKVFANVEARVQPTATGVIVIFSVTEQKQIHEIRFEGNLNIKNDKLKETIDLQPRQAIDPFRITLARQAIEKLYHDKNFAFAHVTISSPDLVHEGNVIFHIVEGPEVRIKKVDFIGNNSFTAWRLKDQIKTGYYIFIFRAGTFDADQVEQDVISLQKYYQDKGFFDARIGRKLALSPDMKAMQVTFLIDEGQRYITDHVEFKGLKAVPEAALRKNMALLEGRPYDADGIERDKRTIVKAYSRTGGFIYQEPPVLQPDPDYLQITATPRFYKDPGKVDLIYDISEGKQFRLGRILVKGNTRTKDKVVLRELHMRPGQVYDSSEVEDATDRLRGSSYFTNATITPIGDDPHFRDLIVDVTEAHTANVSAGIGVNSNGGFGGQLSYEQKNFDITNVPSSLGELFSDRGFTGAGQDFRIAFQPSTVGTSAELTFSEPYVFDQPYTFSASGYLNDRAYDVYDDDRVGARISVGQRFNYVYSGDVFFRGEDVDIKNLLDPASDRAPEIIAGQGHHTLTSVGFDIQRDTRNHGPITYQGIDSAFTFEQGGALGGNVYFTKLAFSNSTFLAVGEDLLGRKSVIDTNLVLEYDPNKAPFYERLYGGGLGSVRGFQFRGISPRDGPVNDAIGGDFYFFSSLEYSFPIAEDFLRGVIFTDAGDVEPNFRFSTIRVSAGFGFRLVLPIFGQTPLALDFGFPINKNSLDQTQVLSFSFGISR